MSRAISLSYGAAAGAGLVQLGVPALVVVPVGLALGVGLELYHDHQEKIEAVSDD